MNRLITGAEISLLSSAPMYSKQSANLTGDLGSNAANKAGGLLAFKSKEQLGSLELSSQSIDIEMLTESAQDLGMAKSAAEDTVPLPVNTKKGRYSHIKTATINSISDLDEQLRNMEFRNLFRLGGEETILMEELNCNCFLKYSNSFCSGTVYLSENFFCFASYNTEAVQAGTSLIASLDPSLTFSIPYAHIVSVLKQAPTALAYSAIIKLSGYLVISTKQRAEFWLSFATQKDRDRLGIDLLQYIKQVNWKFDDDLIVGQRNVPPNIRASNASVASAPIKTSESNENLLLQDLNGQIDEFTKIGLKFLKPFIGKDGNEDFERSTQADINIWKEYFDTHGKDVCMIKDFKALKKLLLETNGLPELYRGDFWMVVSGAWSTRPSFGYYQALLRDNKHKKNPVAEEIEKDVRR
jgi:hypothetical protein